MTAWDSFLSKISIIEGSYKMKREDLKTEALNIRAALQQNFGSGLRGRSFIEHNSRSGMAMFPPALRRPFDQYLEDKVPPADELYLFTGISGQLLPVYWLAESMLERLIQEDDIDSIIDDMHEFLKAGGCNVDIVRGIVGIIVEQPIEVERGVWLVSPNDVPADINRERLFKIDRWGEPKFNIDAFSFQAQLNAALKFTTHEAKVLGREAEFSLFESARKIYDRINEITIRVCAAACLCSNSSPFPSWTYSAARHPAIGYSNFGGGGGSGSFHPPTPRYATINAEEFSRFYKLLGEMKTGYKNVILALDRLASSRARHVYIDKAIDLGIALEVILLNQIKEGELSFRLRTRGAWLLGSDFAERDRVSKLLGKIYSLRSQAAHNGEFDDKSTKDASFVEILNAGEEICRNVIEQILLRGSFPDWDSLTLGKEIS